MNKQELVEAILEESYIHHNISISNSKLSETTEDEIDNEEYQQIMDGTAESLVEMFATDWETNHSGKIYVCGRSGATIYWDQYWNESDFKYPDYQLKEDDWEKESLCEILKDIREFNKAVEGLMIDFYSNVNDSVSDAMVEKARQDTHDKLYNKTLKVIKKNDFTKRLFYDLIYKEL